MVAPSGIRTPFKLITLHLILLAFLCAADFSVAPAGVPAGTGGRAFDSKAPVRASVLGWEPRGGDSDVWIYTLLLFDVDSPALDTLDRRILRECILADIPPGARVEAVGYTDVTGLDGHDLSLAVRRATSVVRRLQSERGAIDGVRFATQGVGRLDSPYSNEFPEGRCYNRTVQIRVTVPAGTRR